MLHYYGCSVRDLGHGGEKTAPNPFFEGTSISSSQQASRRALFRLDVFLFSVCEPVWSWMCCLWGRCITQPEAPASLAEPHGSGCVLFVSPLAPWDIIMLAGAKQRSEWVLQPSQPESSCLKTRSCLSSSSLPVLLIYFSETWASLFC